MLFQRLNRAVWLIAFCYGGASLFASDDLYPSDLKNRFLTASALPQNLCLHSCLGLRQLSLAPDKNSEEPPCQTPDSSGRLGIYRNVQAVIFDCDGILVDTEYLKFLAWQEALASEAIEFSIEEYMPLVGHSSKNILQMIKQSKKVEISDEIIELKNAKYKMLQERGVPAIQAMVDFAYHLSANKSKLGISLGLASSASQSEILTNLRQIGLESAFDLVISGSDDLDDYIDAEGKNKPKPYIYIEASKRLNILPEFCLVFEDTTAGVDAAADAGMIPIAVPNPFTLNHDFSKAVRVFSSHEKLPSIEVFQR